jgi:hypothetical protein
VCASSPGGGTDAPGAQQDSDRVPPLTSTGPDARALPQRPSLRMRAEVYVPDLFHGVPWHPMGQSGSYEYEQEGPAPGARLWMTSALSTGLFVLTAAPLTITPHRRSRHVARRVTVFETLAGHVGSHRPHPVQISALLGWLPIRRAVQVTGQYEGGKLRNAGSAGPWCGISRACWHLLRWGAWSMPGTRQRCISRKRRGQGKKKYAGGAAVYGTRMIQSACAPGQGPMALMFGAKTI